MGVESNIAPSSQITVIEPGGLSFAATFAEVWKYRELMFFLAWRDVSVKYRQTVLGVTWVVLQPIATMLIFTAVFNRLAKISAGEVPYPLFVLAGLLPWTYFSASVGRSSESLVSSAGVIGKVYFPRLLIPMSACISGMVDFLISFVVLGGVMAWYGFVPNIVVIVLPLLIVYDFILAAAVGILFSALNAKYRDVRFVLSFLMQIWFYLTPVVYPLGLVPEKYRAIAMFNPMVGVVESFRWCLIGGAFPQIELAVSTAMCLIIFIVAQFYFRSTERTLVDVI